MIKMLKLNTVLLRQRRHFLAPKFASKQIKAISTVGTLLGALLLLGNAGMAGAQEEEGPSGPLDPATFSSTLTFTSDYAFRGTTFSASEPAIQGSFDWGYGPWFAGAWASSLINQDVDKDFNALRGGANMEIDYYFGWADSVGGVDLMVMPLVYTFPGQDSSGARDDTTFELWTSAGYTVGIVNLGLEINWAPDEYFDNGDSSLYYKGKVGVTLPMDFGIDVGYGYTDIGDNNDFFADDYAHVEVGLTKALLGFDLDLRYHDNLDEDKIGDNFALESEVVFSISRSM